MPLTTASRAEIRFLNLVGDRYMALEQGGPRSAERLNQDDTIPISRRPVPRSTSPCCSTASSRSSGAQPQAVNELSLNMVRVLQGEGGTIQSLLASTASLTNTLANRDQLIGEVITT